jgi:hypothetical protein
MSISAGDINGVRNYFQSDWLGMFEPKVFAGVNIISNFWICASYWYMAPFGVDFYDINSRSLSGSAFGIGIYMF